MQRHATLSVQHARKQLNNGGVARRCEVSSGERRERGIAHPFVLLKRAERRRAARREGADRWGGAGWGRGLIHLAWQLTPGQPYARGCRGAEGVYRAWRGVVGRMRAPASGSPRPAPATRRAQVIHHVCPCAWSDCVSVRVDGSVLAGFRWNLKRSAVQCRGMGITLRHGIVVVPL